MNKTQKIASDLRNASSNNTHFDSIVEAIRSQRTITKIEMREIAELFLGHSIKKAAGRKAALQEIISRQAINARQKARGREIDRHMRAW